MPTGQLLISCLKNRLHRLRGLRLDILRLAKAEDRNENKVQADQANRRADIPAKRLCQLIECNWDNFMDKLSDDNYLDSIQKDIQEEW